MNVVAANVPLSAGDEVLLTDHEYGAVVRIWGQACKRLGARTVLAHLPDFLESKDAIVEALFGRVSDRTRMIVVSHVTSPTAVILPVQEICQKAREQGIMVCVDGPHAPLMVDINLRKIDCDFYTASCHKWLSAPFGAGFLYVRSRFKQGLRPSIVSWGKNFAGRPAQWQDEFHWPGTFDPTPYLTIPEAIRFFESVGVDHFRQETHRMAQRARQGILGLSGMTPLTPDSSDWYASMVTIPLLREQDPPGHPSDAHPLQRWLWEEHRIEVPVIAWRDRTHIRVSCHLYNTPEQVDTLLGYLDEWLHR